MKQASEYCTFFLGFKNIELCHNIDTQTYIVKEFRNIKFTYQTKFKYRRKPLDSDIRLVSMTTGGGRKHSLELFVGICLKKNTKKKVKEHTEFISTAYLYLRIHFKVNFFKGFSRCILIVVNFN